MASITKKDLLLDCTMRTVAEHGLMSVSMQMITKMAGTSEGLIYKHYGTKEELLLHCYLSIYEEIKETLDDLVKEPHKTDDKDEMFAFLHKIWKRFFIYLLNNKYKTLYFYEYRNSAYIKTAAMSGKIDPKNFFAELVKIFYALDEKFDILHKIDIKWLFYYVTDVSVVFAIRLINEETVCDEKMLDAIWNLVWGGEGWLIN